MGYFMLIYKLHKYIPVVILLISLFVFLVCIFAYVCVCMFEYGPVCVTRISLPIYSYTHIHMYT